MSGPITRESLSLAQQLATDLLVQWAETGEPPFSGETPVDLDQAVEQLDEWLRKHEAALIGSGVDFVFGVVASQLFPNVPIERYEAAVAEMGPEAIVAATEAVSEQAMADANQVEARRAAALDFREIALGVARGALAAGLMAAISA